jgi:hypothetical protein
MYAKGFKQRQTWMDDEGFTITTGDMDRKERPKITYLKFLRELKSLLGVMAEEKKEEVYAELLVHVRTLLKRRDSR